jgi:sorbitol-specific phosphotransferase system component IIC
MGNLERERKLSRQLLQSQSTTAANRKITLYVILPTVAFIVLTQPFLTHGKEDGATTA